VGKPAKEKPEAAQENPDAVLQKNKDYIKKNNLIKLVEGTNHRYKEVYNSMMKNPTKSNIETLQYYSGAKID
jgi:hypothetical protein